MTEPRPFFGVTGMVETLRFRGWYAVRDYLRSARVVEDTEKTVSADWAGRLEFDWIDLEAERSSVF